MAILALQDIALRSMPDSGTITKYFALAFPAAVTLVRGGLVPRCHSGSRQLRGGLLSVVVPGLNLLLLLHDWPDFLGVLVIIRQPQPDLRHLAQATPRVAVSKRVRHL
jgi:hypothetical protein